MGSTGPGAARGRRKQAKPQRKVELEVNGSSEGGYNSILTEIAATATASSMSPDTNHNELTIENQNALDIGIKLKEGSIPDQVITNNHQQDIQRYLQRSDTVVIYPESVENATSSNEKIVPSLTPNGSLTIKEENGSPEYFIKCPQCQKGCQTIQQLKEHMESSHPELCASENGGGPTVSPTPSLVGPGGPFACSQCANASFPTKDQLEKHELLHSPNAQVSCKICNKTFANVYRLQRHMISHDESVLLRKFKCTECDKAFKFKHHLKEHIRIHSGEKPFECGNCGKRFSHSGSYSSHMTSKKCLVMNLKLGRTRGPSSNSLLDKSNTRAVKRSANNTSINNNITTTNHNSFLPILPKYDAAAATAAAALFQNPAMPFYMASPTGHMNHYTMPNIGQILEQLQLPPPKVSPSMDDEDNLHSDKHEEDLLKPKKTKSEDCDMEEIDTKDIKREVTNGNTNGDDFEAVKRILATVNASVTQEFFRANMQKFSDSNSNSDDGHSVASGHSPSEHESAEANEGKSEGLAAKLEDVLTTNNKVESESLNGAISGNEDDSDRRNDRNVEYEMDGESIATTAQVTEDGRKVRMRSLISDEQLKVLKDNYALNTRPKREELSKIAEQIGFPVRVVQVWFQNTRARDRREGRLINLPYSTPTLLPPASINYLKNFPRVDDQPLDLSIKKDASRESSPSNSPQRPASSHHSGDSGEELAVNLSYKSSRSPTPFQQVAYHQGSNSSMDAPHRSPSPIDLNSSSSRLAQILAQPHKLGLAMVPMERLMQFGPPDLPCLQQIISSRMSNISPNSDKRSSWGENGELNVDDEDSNCKRAKMSSSQLMLKSLGSPNTQDGDSEGQFACDQCDKSFAKQSSLARHKYEHSGQRPHKCDECTKAFKHKHHLTEHKRLHSGEKPFQCCKCLKRFSHSGSYSQHMNHRYSYCKPYRE